VLLDIRAGVMACEHMYNENSDKIRKHDNIMDQARKDPESLLKKLQEGQEIE
jgi:hypothetical protein